MRGFVVAGLLALAISGCGSQPIKVDASAAKTVRLTVRMVSGVGSVPGAGDAYEFTNAAGGWAIYADADPVGYFSFDRPVTFIVPANARSLSLNLSEHRFSGQNPLERFLVGPPTKHGLTDISRFVAGSQINVTCDYQASRHLSFTQGTSLIDCVAS